MALHFAPQPRRFAHTVAQVVAWRSRGGTGSGTVMAPTHPPVLNPTQRSQANTMLITLLLEHPAAAFDILRHTPPWVGFLLAGLVALGLSQWRERRASLARLSLLPIAMVTFSVLGLARDFAPGGTLASAIGGWLAGFALAALLLRRLNAPSGVRFDRSSARLHLPGSPWPLLLILAIFLLKYAVGIELAMQPQAASEQAFVLAVAACYGALSGVFASRAAALWRLARHH